MNLLPRAKSSRDLVDRPSREYPTDPSQYQLLDDCGRGVSATVHRALCIPFNEEVAVKKMNLESMAADLDAVMKEAHTMRSYHHPNVLTLHTSFIVGSDLYMVMPFCDGGSVLHIMKYKEKEGLEEVVIASIMKEVLEALKYVHANGGIHRDVKAGNILINCDGSIRLGDFGVAASTQREGSWGNDKASRTTFVGTPCWMAPEVMEQTQPYDARADIWSFGITLLELAQGHAPFAKYPPMKVLLMTLQRPPPQLEAQDGRKSFSRAMKEVVALCLQKDPADRPSAEKLLAHKFFKQAQSKEYLRKHLMIDLPPLSERVREIRTGGGKAATNAADNDRQLAASQEEYVKGVSMWNFDVGALKAAAAKEVDPMPSIAEGSEERDTDGGSSVHSRRVTADAASSAGANSANSSLSRCSQGATLGSLAAADSPPGQQPGGPEGPAAAAAGTEQLAAHLLPPGRLPARSMSAFAGGTGAAAAVLVVGPGAAGGGGPAATANGVPPHPPPALTLSQSEPHPAAAAGPPSSGGDLVGSCGGSTASPALGSPVISREGSAQGPLAAVAALNAVGSSSGKSGKVGRFMCYGPNDVVPPMSPQGRLPPSPIGSHMDAAVAAQSYARSVSMPTATSAAAAAAGAGGGGQQLLEGRCSDGGEGSRPPLGAAEAAELMAAATAATAAAGTAHAFSAVAGGGGSGVLLPSAGGGPGGAAPKPPAPLSLGSSSSVGESLDNSTGTAGLEQRGRFKVMEHGPSRGSISKVPSAADLRSSSHKGDMKVSGGGILGSGGPPVSGLSISSSSVTGMVLTRLLELQEQAKDHQSALGRLVDCVREVGLGKPLVGTPGGAAGGSGGLLGVAGHTSVSLGGAPGVSLGGGEAAGSSRGRMPPGLSRTPSARGMAGVTLQQLLAEGDNPADVAGRLLERVKELERKNMELAEEMSRYRMRPSDAATQVLGLGEAPDSSLSSRRTSHLSLAPSLAATTGGGAGGPHSTCVGSSAGGSTVVSPTLSPRPEGTPRTSVDM